MTSEGQADSNVERVRCIWRDSWAELAQHDPADARYDQQFHQQIESRVQQQDSIESEQHRSTPLTPQQQEAAATLNADITADEVSASVRRLATSKSPGSDGIPSELLRNGGKMMLLTLHRLCCIVWTAGEVPLDWLRGKVVPLHKDGDKRAPLNYRPITLLSIVGKVYTGVLNNRLMQWSEQSGLIVPEQGGFRPNRGCPEQLFTLTELISLRRLRGRSTYTCFIDIQKAYDTVWHAGLKARLSESGITGRMYRAICSLYAGCESTIRLGESSATLTSSPSRAASDRAASSHRGSTRCSSTDSRSS